jgi:hypothetical protein
MVGLGSTIHPSTRSGACGGLDLRDKPEDDMFAVRSSSPQTGTTVMLRLLCDMRAQLEQDRFGLNHLASIDR